MNLKVNNEKTQKLLDFIEKSPTSCHAARNIADKLVSAGYTELYEHEKWSLITGGKYFVMRNQSSVIAFAIPEDGIKGFMIAAAHSDSPAFKIKTVAESGGEKYVQLNTEAYGGMIYSTWLDCPLSVAGRVAVSSGGDIEMRLVNIDRDLLIIPNVAIHMNRQINTGFAYNPAVDLQPLFASGSGKGEFKRIIAEAAGADENEVIGAELTVYNRQKGMVWGHDGEFISSPRLDDLQCAYALIEGFIAAENIKSIPVCCIFDNEEVGSGTRQGAGSTFLPEVLRRICSLLGKTEEGYQRAIADSFLVSADNAHGVHPNYTEKTDPTNRPYLNHGIVLKYNAAQKYTTDAWSGAVIKYLCKKEKIPCQVYYNRSDMAGGSTLGNILTGQVSMRSADIGLAQLAMHSSYETAGAKDLEFMIRLMTAFYGIGREVEL